MSTVRATVVVAQDGKGDHRSIAAAVAAAPAGALILVRPGTYEEQVRVGHDLELAADGPDGSVRIVAPSACLSVAGGTVTVMGIAFWQGQPKPSGLARFAGRGAPSEAVPATKVPPSVAAVQVESGALVLHDCLISAASGLAIGTGGPDTRLEVRRTRIHRVTGGIAVIAGATALIEDCAFSECAFDAVWASRPSSRLEIRRCTFQDGAGQAIYVDKEATATIEECEISAANAGVFVADVDTEALVRANTMIGCVHGGLLVGGGARVVADGNTISDSQVGIGVFGASTRVEITRGTLEGNGVGLSVAGRASATATGVEIVRGRNGAFVGASGSRLELVDCHVLESAEDAVQARNGGTLIVQGGEVGAANIAVLGLDPGSDVTVRGARVHGNRASGISIGAGVAAVIEANDVFDNAFPGIVTVGGRAKILDNRVHDHRSNGIAIRGGADAVVEGNELWGNELPAITVLGAGTHALVRENSVHDNIGEGIYVHEGAAAEVIANRMVRNGGAAITISDQGVSASVERNVIEDGNGPGIWVADGAAATIEKNEVRGTPEAGICVNNGARAQARENVVTGASVGVVVEAAGGNFVGNRLRGNQGGSWCLIDPGDVTRDGNEEESLALPAWAASDLDAGRYVLLALRVGAELGIPPGDVEGLGSPLALGVLAASLRTAPIGEFGERVRVHLEAHPAADAALPAPPTLLPVPGWAAGILERDAYTQFADCVSSISRFRPDEVGILGSAYALPTLATACRDAPSTEWPALVQAHFAKMGGDFDVAHDLVRNAALDPAAVRDRLVVWLDVPGASDEARVTRPLAATGFVEVLGVYASEAAVRLTATAATFVGAPEELFDLGAQAVRRALEVVPAGHDLLSGDAWEIKGLPSPTAAIGHLMTWLPEVVGPYGALVAVGDALHLIVLPLHDASAVLDLPQLLGLAAGAASHAPWAIPPTVFWVGPATLEAIVLSQQEGVVTGATASTDLAALVARLPAEPRRLPPGLEEILGPDGARRFYGLLHAEVLERLLHDAADVAVLAVPAVRDFAGSCRGSSALEWRSIIARGMDGMAAPRRELDRLTLATDYESVAPSLVLHVSRDTVAGSELGESVGGGLTVYPTIGVGSRYRRVTRTMLERWGVDAERCRRDAAVNTALQPDMVDEPMYPDQPSVRALYAHSVEREAAGLFLHLRYPDTRRGFVVSVTHGSRAHYVRLDDPGAIAMIPVFANVIADIYRQADAAADAHSSWLFWLTPEGRIVPLVDVLQPLPPPAQLPPDFVAMAEGGRPRFQN